MAIPTCGGAVICTFDGRPLSAPVPATIEGPPGLSVADAQVEEGPDATLAFPITLDRAATRTVTVEAATADGTATAGEDYRAKTLTKTFAPGETRKVAVIRVLEDAVDDDGETLTLTQSNPSGAYLADAEATGTIGGADTVTVAYVGSAIHPLADASGLRSGPWDGLAVVNVTGTEYPLPVHVAPMPHGGDPLASAVAGALRLNASGAGLTDLPGLAHLTALERLDLSGNRVVDLSALAGLSNLTVLVLDGNPVTDLGALTHLASLENLGIAGTGVGDVTALQDLAALRRLDLGGTGVANLLPLTDVGSLVWLTLPGDGLGAPDALGRLTRLRWVWADPATGQ